MRTLPEPRHDHGSSHAHSGTAVLLCNLGTPDAPTASALRRYLGEFLGDARVVEIPRPIWWLILHGIILRVRPAKSAAKYASVWTDQGSPLMVWTVAQAQGLQQRLNDAGHQVTVRHAMRYGSPAMPQVLDELKAAGHQRILMLPLYPQYSGTTTASLFDAIAHWGLKVRALPAFRFVNRYHDDAGYIHALATRVREHWASAGRGDKLVLSFHGVPKRTLLLGDPYHCECLKTGRLLAEALGLGKTEVQVTFQSRFGKAEWLQPYTEPTLVALAQGGLKKVDVFCPGFPADCLETLEEISMEAKHAFMAAGGTQFHYIPCLNDHPAWTQALADIALRELGGWPTHKANDAAERAAQKQRALALGAAE